MGSSVHQRDLLSEFSKADERVGQEMPHCTGDVKETQHCGTITSKIPTSHLGGIYTEEHSKGCQQEQKEVEGGVVRESMFSSEWATEAFCKLTDRQQQYLTVYFRTCSPTLTAQELGLRSAKNVGKEINRLAKAIGFSSVLAMRVDAGVGVDNKEQATSATYKELLQLLEQQGYRCALTGKQLTPQTARLDHKSPVSDGGSHEVSNLHWVLETVNTAKGVMNLDQFVGMCIDVARWAQL